MKQFFIIIFAVLINLHAAGWLLAEEPVITASYDKRQAAVGEEIRLTIKVSGAAGNVQAPRLPAFKGFDTYYTGRASHLTFINGRSTSTLEFSYVLVPQTPGTYTLSPIEMTVQGRAFRTDPVQIEVTSPIGGAPLRPQPSPYQQPSSTAAGGGFAPSGGASGNQPIAQEPPPIEAPDDDNIFVKAWIDKNSVYPNEQVVLTYSLYTRYDTRYEGFQDEPQVSGFWIEEFPMERDVERETVRINGKRYVKADVKKVALFPTSPSEYTINPGSLKVSIRQEPQSSSVFDEFFDDSFFSGGGFFARRENRLLKPPVLNLSVKPLPEQGKPESFNGAVGSYQMTATVDKTSVKQNDPVTLKIVIEGQGAIETLNRPKIPETPGFKTYDGDSSSQLFKQGNVIGGKKNFEVVFIPTKAGAMTIPSIEFSFFNPMTRAYQRLQTPVYRLNVEAVESSSQLPDVLSQSDFFKKEIQKEGQDIRSIGERLPDDRPSEIMRSALFGLSAGNALLSLLVLIGLWKNHQDSVFKKDNALKRKRYAKSHAESRIRKLKSKVKGADRDGLIKYFDEVERILTQYVSDRFNLSTLGITRPELEKTLEEVLGPQDPLHKDIIELYRLCDESRFARAEVSADLKMKAQKIVREAIGRLEKVK